MSSPNIPNEADFWQCSWGFFRGRDLLPAEFSTLFLPFAADPIWGSFEQHAELFPFARYVLLLVPLVQTQRV
jgi:hypothetical protein